MTVLLILFILVPIGGTMNHSFDDLGPKDHELLWLNDVGMSQEDAKMRTDDGGMHHEDVRIRIDDEGVRHEDVGMRTDDVGVRHEDVRRRTDDVGVQIYDVGMQTDEDPRVRQDDVVKNELTMEIPNVITIK